MYVHFQVLCEVPESYEAYRKQQHRWHSGPMQLFRLCLPAIITSKVPQIVNLDHSHILITYNCSIRSSFATIDYLNKN